MNAIVDTGFLVALLEAHDQHHAWAMEVAEEIRWPALTCESVLSEIFLSCALQRIAA